MQPISGALQNQFRDELVNVELDSAKGKRLGERLHTKESAERLACLRLFVIARTRFIAIVKMTGLWIKCEPEADGWSQQRWRNLQSIIQYLPGLGISTDGKSRRSL